MNVEEIKSVIVSQREENDEIFQREKIIERECERKTIDGYIKYPNILAILGVRRGGKSTFSLQIFENKKFGYINFDDERIAGITHNDLDKVLQSFYELYGSDVEHIILDEPQNVEGWELFANRLRRTKKVIITGSSAKLLSGELATHLTGRYIDFTLFPFSFREFLRYEEFKFEKQDAYSTKRVSEIKRKLESYIDTGGFSEAYKFGKKIVSKIYEDIINKDILGRHNIKYKKTFREIAKYLITNFSGEMTFSKLKEIFSIDDVHTIRNYVDYANSTYLIYVLERFSFKLKQQMIAPKKVYCIDTGLINAVSFKTSQNLGRLIENVVAVELLRRKSYWNENQEIYYWKDHQQKEVDFVIKEGQKVKELIQVCYDIEDYNIKQREVKALMKASKELKCKDLLVITWDYEAEEEFEGKRVKFLPLWKWLLKIEEIKPMLRNSA